MRAALMASGNTRFAPLEWAHNCRDAMSQILINDYLRHVQRADGDAPNPQRPNAREKVLGVQSFCPNQVPWHARNGGCVCVSMKSI
jgi:hypothetical protein